MRHEVAASLLLVGISFFGAGCRPSREDCEKSWDRVVEITLSGREGEKAQMGKAFLDSVRPKYVDRCVKDGTRSEVRCILDAKTQEDLDRCGGLPPEEEAPR